MVIFYFEKDTKALRFIGWVRVVYVFGGMTVFGAQSFTEFGTEFHRVLKVFLQVLYRLDTMFFLTTKGTTILVTHG